MLFTIVSVNFLNLEKNYNNYSLSTNQSRRLHVRFQLGSFSMDVQIYIPYLVVSKSLFGTLDTLPVLAILCPGLVWHLRPCLDFTGS